jgi:hypothetical protein
MLSPQKNSPRFLLLNFLLATCLFQACGSDGGAGSEALGDVTFEDDGGASSEAPTLSTSSTESGGEQGSGADDDGNGTGGDTVSSNAGSSGTDPDDSGNTTGTGANANATDGTGTSGTNGQGGATNGGGSGTETSAGGETSSMEPVPCDGVAECDNGFACDGLEQCEDGFCAAGVPVECDDGVECTLDVCSASTGECEFLPQNSQCSDDVFCNGVEICDAAEGCQPGTPPLCVDTIDCTADSCDEANDRCAFAPDDSICADATFCNGDELCDVGLGCQAGPARSCDDQIACTTDSCDEDTAACVNTPDDQACSNGVFCDGAEVCVEGVGCEAGSAVSCNGDSDGVACTNDECSEVALGCVAVPDSSLCPAGEFCLQDTGCEEGQACSTDDDCDDNDACNGIEVCETVSPGSDRCVPGEPVVCDDSLSCTDDSCDMDTGECVFTPQDGRCADTNLCNGSEVCDLVEGCIAGAPLDCDDGVDCTDDTSCLPAAGCLNRPIDDLCQDISACNGEETCDAVLGCQAGEPLVCGTDGVDCTIDRCDDEAGGCVHDPDDAACAPMTCAVDAPSLTCDATLGCGNHCSPATCQGKLYLCGDCKDNEGDCRADDRDGECFGACSNNESGFKGEIPGQNQNPCQKMDCYFDQDSGSGNDNCYWSQSCDPLEPMSCNYDADSSIPGTGSDCAEAQATQSATCNSFCGELTPNGCDCFGCCDVEKDGNSYTIFLGSEDSGGEGSCNLAVVDQPDKCHPCTQVEGCLNSCDVCELCLGKDELPAACEGQQNCGEQTPCGLPGQAACDEGQFCLTGCCVSF